MVNTGPERITAPSLAIVSEYSELDADAALATVCTLSPWSEIEHFKHAYQICDLHVTFTPIRTFICPISNSRL